MTSRFAEVKREDPAVFAELLRDAKVTEAKVAAAALRSVRPPPPPPGYDEPEAVARRETFGRLCRELVALGEPRAVALEMAADEGVMTLARAASSWLKAFLPDRKAEARGRSGLALAAEVGCRLRRLEAEAPSDWLAAHVLKVASVLAGGP